MKSVLLLLAVSFTSSCFLQRNYVNEAIEPQRLEGLEPGSTTAAEVVELLGAPNEVVQLGRRTAYRYEHDQQKSAGLWALVVVLINRDTQSDRVWVFFDEEDVLTHVGVTLQADEAEYAMPWSEHD